jgi:3-hydroxyisobutyrate dehydrogenase-like beta-hydroxyacid dehydrogenase
MAAIGFLGAGNMGSALVRRLLDTGHEVLVWNRTAATAQPLVDAGARLAASAAEALEAPVSFSMLADDAAIEEVLTSDALADAGLGVHVNMASTSPAAADRLAATAARADVGYVAAPVMGRPALAEAGKLNILAAGADADLARVEPYLTVLGSRVWRFGTNPRAANVVKVAATYNLPHMMQALGESIAMVEAHGVPAGDFVELLTNSLFGGVAYTAYGSAIAEQRYLPKGFGLELGLKDLGLAQEVAAEGGVHLATAPLLREIFAGAIADPELRHLDWAAVAEMARRNRLTGLAQPPA